MRLSPICLIASLFIAGCSGDAPQEPTTGSVFDTSSAFITCNLTNGNTIATNVESANNASTLTVKSLKNNAYLGIVLVTRAQWQTVMGTTPWVGALAANSVGDDVPATNISRIDSLAFTQRLNDKFKGLVIFSLPTATQWKTAIALASGKQGALYPWGDGDGTDQGAAAPVLRELPSAITYGALGPLNRAGINGWWDLVGNARQPIAEGGWVGGGAWDLARTVHSSAITNDTDIEFPHPLQGLRVAAVKP